MFIHIIDSVRLISLLHGTPHSLAAKSAFTLPKITVESDLHALQVNGDVMVIIFEDSEDAFFLLWKEDFDDDNLKVRVIILNCSVTLCNRSTASFLAVCYRILAS